MPQSLEADAAVGSVVCAQPRYFSGSTGLQLHVTAFYWQLSMDFMIPLLRNVAIGRLAAAAELTLSSESDCSIWTMSAGILLRYHRTIKISEIKLSKTMP